MNLFSSLKWFRSQKEKELEELQVEEQKLKNKLLEEDLKIFNEPKPDPNIKPWKSIKFTNDLLTVVLHDGTVISKVNSTQEEFHKVRNASKESDVLGIILIKEPKKESNEDTKKEEIANKALEGFDYLKGLKDFEIVGNSVYMTGTGRTLPPLLVARFAEIVNKYRDDDGEVWDIEQDDEYQALKRFFLWCCLNPRAEVVDKLYDFLIRNDMKITKQGFFVGLRNVVTVEGGNHQLVDFITNTYQKIKTVWKKKPSDYFIWSEDDGTFVFSKDKQQDGISKLWGNLQDLYLNLPDMEENRYTDNHSHSFDIRIGKVVNMPPEECNWSNADCAKAGLHFAGHTAPYVLCGNTTIFTLHNPMKVVGIGSEKGRCWEYLPFMTTTVEEAQEIMTSGDFDFLELDEQYAINELEGLSEKVKEGFSKEARKYEFNLPSLSSEQIKSIVVSLEEMKEVLTKRVTNI